MQFLFDNKLSWAGVTVSIIIHKLEFENHKISINQQMNPIPLIQFNEDSFSLTQQAKKFLLQLDQPLGVITIVGKYRTGKSLFLNKILLNNKQQLQEQQQTNAYINNKSECNFKVCPTINSCTKGLWISKQTIKSQHPQHEGLKVLVIDSEGFGAMQQSDAYCNNILLLALLLSSYFIYNSVGSIDQKSLNNLNIITNLSKQLQSKNMQNDKLEEEFPTFMWVVRDFTLKIVDSNGYQIQPKQYLEQALKIRKGVSDAIQSKNKIRRMIKHFFKDRDCSTLVTPVTNQQQLQKLNTLADDELRPQFLEQITTLRQKILRRIKPKKLKNKIITGVTLVQIAEKFIQAINKGSLPNLDSAWRHVANLETKKSVEKIRQGYQSKIQIFLQTIHDESEIQHFEKGLLEQILEKCKKFMNFENQVTENYEKLKEQMETKMLSIRKQNKKNSMSQLIQIYNKKSSKFQCSQQYCAQQLYKQITQLNVYFQNAHGNNPGLPQFLLENFYPSSLQKLQKYSIYSQKSLKQCRQVIENNKVQYKQLIQQRDDQLNKKLRQMQALSQEMSIIKIKQGQSLKIKELENNFLAKQIQENRDQIRILLQKLQKNQDRLSQYRNQYHQIKLLHGNLQQSNIQVQNSVKFLKKQVTILENTLLSKNQQMQSIKNKAIQLQFELQKAQQRQKILVSRLKAQIQNKSADCETIMDKYQESHRQVLQLTEKLARIQTKFDERQIQMSQQKTLYQGYLTTMKNNLQMQMKQRNQLMETNSNMGFALKNLEHRFQHIQQKQKKLKEFKRCIKNSSCLQCINCSKFFVPTIFAQHLNVCVIQSNLSNNQQQSGTNGQQMDITVLQTLLKDSDAKPYTEYVLSVFKGKKNWKIQRKYKTFCELHSQLKTQFPGILLSEYSFIVNPQEGTKKSLMVEQRKKILQKYLKDLCRNSLVLHSRAWRQFIGEGPDTQLTSIQSPTKKALYQLIKSNNVSGCLSPDKQNCEFSNKHGYKSPQQFLKVWNQRNIRVKQVAKNHKLK